MEGAQTRVCKLGVARLYLSKSMSMGEPADTAVELADAGKYAQIDRRDSITDSHDSPLSESVSVTVTDDREPPPQVGYPAPPRACPIACLDPKQMRPVAKKCALGTFYGLVYGAIGALVGACIGAYGSTCHALHMRNGIQQMFPAVLNGVTMVTRDVVRLIGVTYTGDSGGCCCTDFWRTVCCWCCTDWTFSDYPSAGSSGANLTDDNYRFASDADMRAIGMSIQQLRVWTYENIGTPDDCCGSCLTALPFFDSSPCCSTSQLYSCCCCCTLTPANATALGAGVGASLGCAAGCAVGCRDKAD